MTNGIKGIKIRKFIMRLMLMVFLSSACISAASVIFAPAVHADDPGGGGEVVIEDDDSIIEKIGTKNLGFNAYVGRLWVGVKANLIQKDFVEALKFTDAEVQFANQIWSALSIIGVCFAVIYFIMDLNRAAFMAASNWTIQSLISPMLKFGACMFVIQYGGRFVSLILGFGNWFTGQMADSIMGGAVEISATEAEMLKDMNLGVAIAFLLCMMIFWIISQCVAVIFLYKAISWKIEVIIRAGVTPVILGDVWEGKNSGAVRWLKKLAGCVMYGGLMLVIMRVGSDVMAANFGDAGLLGDPDSIEDTGHLLIDLLGAVAGSIVIPIAEIGAMSAAKQASMEVWS